MTFTILLCFNCKSTTSHIKALKTSEKGRCSVPSGCCLESFEFPDFPLRRIFHSTEINYQTKLCCTVVMNCSQTQPISNHVGLMNIFRFLPLQQISTSKGLYDKKIQNFFCFEFCFLNQEFVEIGFIW